MVDEPGQHLFDGAGENATDVDGREVKWHVWLGVMGQDWQFEKD